MTKLSVRLFAVAALIGAAACDTSTPVAPATDAARNMAAAPTFDMNHASGLSNGAFYHTTFTLTSAGGVFQVGPFFTLNFPANSVCDPNTSSYGPGHWDESCQTLAAGQSVTETVTIGVNNGVLMSDYSTPIRFSPNAVVTASTHMFESYIRVAGPYYAARGLGLRLGIDYAPSLGAAAVSDALSDPSVATHVDSQTGLVWRRIKHFSGYNVTSGEPCTPSPADPDCIDTGDGTQQ